MKYKHRNSFIKIASCMLLCAYLMFISWRMFFYAYGSYYRSRSILPEYNLIPFKTILNLIISCKYYKFDVWVYNFFGNIAAFMPLGILLPVVLGIKRKFAATLAFSMVFLLSAETAQLIFRVGVFDIDDIILNIIGVLSGYMIYLLMEKHLRPLNSSAK